MTIKRLLILCVGIAALFVFPAFYIDVESGGSDPRVFNDWDEAHYLSLLRDAERVTTQSLITWENGRLAVFDKLQTHIPHRLSDVFVGWVYKVSGVSITTFSILLDFTCISVSLLILTLCFSMLRGENVNECSPVSLASAMAVLFIPWLSSEIFHLLPDHIGPMIRSKSHNGFPSFPVMRAVYTQLSLPLFFLGFLSIIRFVQSRGANRFALVASILCAAVLAYVYFFAWLALTFVVASFLFFGLLFRLLSLRPLLPSLLFGAVLYTLICFPALQVLFPDGEVFVPGLASLNRALYVKSFHRQLWYFNPLEGLIVILLAWRVFRSRERILDPTVLLLFCMLAVLATKFPLMNLQPIIGRGLTPYHFPLFYLDPLLSGLFVAMCFRFVPSARVQRMFLGVLAFTVLIVPVYRFIQLRRQTPEWSEERELLKYLEEESRVLNIVTMPFQEPFNYEDRVTFLLLPYWIRTLTEHEMVMEFAIFDNDRLRLMQYELLLGWIYGEKLGRIAYCPGPIGELYVEDLLQGAEAFFEWQRYWDCQLSREIELESSLCSLLHQFPIDFILEQDGIPTSFENISRFLSKSWSSSGGAYTLYEFDARAAQEEFC